MRKINRQAKNEIRIFKKFAKLCPYPIHLDSITKKEHPEPDISCDLSDGNVVAFELVECIDKRTAQSIYGPQKLKKAFHSKLEKLPKEKKEQFKRIFRDALISVTFIKKVSVNKKRSSMPLILQYLLTVGDTPYGKFNLRSHKGLKDVVDCISINQVDSGRPTFDVKDPNFFNDTCRERIQDKFVKEYEIKSRADLLAYYELQYEFPESYWLPLVKSFVEGNIESSVFQRVWIYSVTKNKIMFVYPVL